MRTGDGEQPVAEPASPPSVRPLASASSQREQNNPAPRTQHQRQAQSARSTEELAAAPHDAPLPQKVQIVQQTTSSVVLQRVGGDEPPEPRVTRGCTVPFAQPLPLPAPLLHSPTTAAPRQVHLLAPKPDKQPEAPVPAHELPLPRSPSLEHQQQAPGGGDAAAAPVHPASLWPSLGGAMAPISGRQPPLRRVASLLNAGHAAPLEAPPQGATSSTTGAGSDRTRVDDPTDTCKPAPKPQSQIQSQPQPQQAQGASQRPQTRSERPSSPPMAAPLPAPIPAHTAADARHGQSAEEPSASAARQQRSKAAATAAKAPPAPAPVPATAGASASDHGAQPTAGGDSSGAAEAPLPDQAAVAATTAGSHAVTQSAAARPCHVAAGGNEVGHGSPPSRQSGPDDGAPRSRSSLLPLRPGSLQEGRAAGTAASSPHQTEPGPAAPGPEGGGSGAKPSQAQSAAALPPPAAAAGVTLRRKGHAARARRPSQRMLDASPDAAAQQLSPGEAWPRCTGAWTETAATPLLTRILKALINHHHLEWQLQTDSMHTPARHSSIDRSTHRTRLQCALPPIHARVLQETSCCRADRKSTGSVDNQKAASSAQGGSVSMAAAAGAPTVPLSELWSTQGTTCASLTCVRLRCQERQTAAVEMPAVLQPELDVSWGQATRQQPREDAGICRTPGLMRHWESLSSKRGESP